MKASEYTAAPRRANSLRDETLARALRLVPRNFVAGGMLCGSILLGAFPLAHVLVTEGLVSTAYADDSAQLTAVKGLLGQRHFDGSTVALEQAAGGKENLVALLISLRHDEKTPFVAIRAERLLIDYSDHSDAEAALQADLQDAKMKGLARTVVMHLDKVKSDSLRQSLARSAMTRAKSEPDFEPYTRSLHSSSDPVVRSIAGAK